MINSIEEALNKVDDELVIDDCVSLYWAFKYAPETLKKFSLELKQKAHDPAEFYFKERKYKIYNSSAVSELAEFMALKNDKMLAAKIEMNADPRNYITTACVDYGTAEHDTKTLNPNKNKNSLLNSKKETFK